MPESSENSLSYQPKTKAYAFKSNISAVPDSSEAEQKSHKKPNVFVFLALEIVGLLAVFAVFLLILNYFKVISLSSFNQLEKVSQTIQMPGAVYDSKTNLWTVKGTFYGYDEYTLKIKTGFQVVDFKWENSSAEFYDSEASLNSTKYVPVIYSLFDLEQAQNLNKKVIVQYKIINNQKTINNLQLFAL